jgi:glycerate dehydrogenase
VLTTEPPVDGSPLFNAQNCIVTPHIAWATKEARTRLLTTVLENVQGFLHGTPRNIVNG